MPCAGSPPSGYYAWRGRGPCRRRREDAILRERIRDLHGASRDRYGAPKIHVDLAAAGPTLAASWRAHNSLRAVRCGHFLEVDADLLGRPTTRLLDGAESLCAWLEQQVRRAEGPRCRVGAD